MSQFKETRNRFMNATGCKYPITYGEWLLVPNSLKAAALYCNFYDTITLAWAKAKSDFTSDEDGVSIVMQYLSKNVEEIMHDGKKFTSRYIYRVAYNCMGCLRRVIREQDRYTYTASQYAVSDDAEIDLFSIIPDSDSDMLDKISSRALWSLIDEQDKSVQKIVERIINGDRRAISKKNEKKIDAMRNKLRSIYCIDDTPMSTFEDVLRNEPYIKSAVVEMRDGTSAVYYGESRVAPNGSTKVVFFGPTEDYVVPEEIAKSLRVTDVEYK